MRPTRTGDGLGALERSEAAPRSLPLQQDVQGALRALHMQRGGNMRSISAAGPAGVSQWSSVWPGAGKRGAACRGGGGTERVRAALRSKGAAARGNRLAAGAQAHCNSAATLLRQGPLLLAVAISAVCCPCSYSTFYREQWITNTGPRMHGAHVLLCAHAERSVTR